MNKKSFSRSLDESCSLLDISSFPIYHLMAFKNHWMTMVPRPINGRALISPIPTNIPIIHRLYLVILNIFLLSSPNYYHSPQLLR